MINNISQLPYYHREYENDLSGIESESSFFPTAQRIAGLSLPFLSLYKPLGSTLTLGMNLVRTFSSFSTLQEVFEKGISKESATALFHAFLSVASVAATIFGSVYGMAIITGHDTWIHLSQMVQNLQKGENEKALENLLQLVRNSLYFAVLFHGSLEIVLLSFIAQVLTEAFKSQSAFRKFLAGDRLALLEAFAHLAMAGIRTYQMQPQIQKIKMSSEIQKASSESKSISSQNPTSQASLPLKNGKTEVSCSCPIAGNSAVAGTKVYANRVEICKENGYDVHKAYYNGNVLIVTSPENAMQKIYVNGSLDAYSNDFSVVTIDGIVFIRHSYFDGCVYSNDTTQYMELK
jgi:hypothetical protein